MLAPTHVSVGLLVPPTGGGSRERPEPSSESMTGRAPLVLAAGVRARGLRQSDVLRRSQARAPLGSC